MLVFPISRMPFGGVTVKDVDAHEFVRAFAAHLKKYVCFIYSLANTYVQACTSNGWALIRKVVL